MKHGAVFTLLLLLAGSAAASLRLGPELTFPGTSGARSNTELAGLVARDDGVMAFWKRPSAGGRWEIVAAPVTSDGFVPEDIRVVIAGIDDYPAEVIAAGDGYFVLWWLYPRRFGSFVTSELQVRATIPADWSAGDRIACTGSRCGLLDGLRLRIYTFDGRMVGERTYTNGRGALAAAPEGFLTYGSNDEAELVDNDARVVWQAQIPVDALAASVARVDRGWLVLARAGNWNEPVFLFAALLTPSGELVATRRFAIASATDFHAFPSPDGTQVALVGGYFGDFDRTELPLYAMRIRATLDPIDPEMVPIGRAPRRLPAVAAFHGERLLLGWTDDGARIAAIGPRAPLANPASVPVERGMVSQAPAAVAATADRYLGVWYENEGHDRRLLAARIDRSGRHLDPSPIVLAGAGELPEKATAAVVDGNFLVLWKFATGVRGAVIDAGAGTVAPLALDGITNLYARVVPTDDGFAFAGSDGPRSIAIFEVDRHGRIAERKRLAYEPYDIVWAFDRVLATWFFDEVRLATNGREVLRLTRHGYIDQLGPDDQPIPGRRTSLRWSGSDRGPFYLAPLGDGWLVGGGQGPRSVPVAMILDRARSGGVAAGTLRFEPNSEAIDAVAAPGGHVAIVYRRQLPEGTSLLVRELLP